MTLEPPTTIMFRRVTKPWFIGMNDTLLRGSRIAIIAFLWEGREVIIEWSSTKEIMWSVVQRRALEYHTVEA